MPGALPVSRSQTPQQPPYPGFPGNANGGQQFHAPTAYQHLQHGGASNASPSPIMQNQNFHNPSIPQRVQTISPSPFSPAVPTFGSQASPPHSDQGSRVNTPQNGGGAYFPAVPYGGGANQHFTPPPGSTNTGSQGGATSQYSQLPANVQQQQRMIEVRQQYVRQLQANNPATQHQHRQSTLNPAANHPNQINSYQMTGRAQQMQQSMQRPNNPDHFVRGLMQFMQQRALPLNTNPIICGQQINVMQLYATVMKQGGSRRVTSIGAWPAVATSLQLPLMSYPSAGQEILDYWQRNLSAYEDVHLQMQRQQQQQQQQQQHQAQQVQQQRQRALAEQVQISQQAQNGDLASTPGQFSPEKQLNPNLQTQQLQHLTRMQQQSQADYHSPSKQATPSRQSLQNGYLTPQPGHIQARQPNQYATQQAGQPFPQQATPPQAQRQAYPPHRHGTTMKKDSYTDGPHTAVSYTDPTDVMPRKEPIYPHFIARMQSQVKTLNKKNELEGCETWAGIEPANLTGIVKELIKTRPNVPAVSELGVIDVRALTMSLRSGIHAEVRLALDTFASLSLDSRCLLRLETCEDLVEILIDCADEQVDLLAENAAEVSDVMLISPYEEVVRGCRLEFETLQEVPEFGSLEYDLDRSVDRLICITTILRNLSFDVANQPYLADPIIIKFMATVIRYLGTRNLLLRSHRNTLDFTKDIIIYLSNVSHKIDLPGKEEALCMLHFLLSLAPCPPPNTPGTEEIMFSTYIPSVHPYLPPAVDSLAKLLARDEPNRTFYRSIFAADSASTPSYDLLTRTFALAIAPVPDYGNADVSGTIQGPGSDTARAKEDMEARESELLARVKARMPYLAQGMLAAEILATLVPGPEHVLARSWLLSADGFAVNLLRLVCFLTIDIGHLTALAPAPAPPRHLPAARSVQPNASSEGILMITRRGMAVLRKLAEKCKTLESPAYGLLAAVLPSKATVMQALSAIDKDRQVVRQIYEYARLET